MFTARFTASAAPQTPSVGNGERFSISLPFTAASASLRKDGLPRGAAPDEVRTVIRPVVNLSGSRHPPLVLSGITPGVVGENERVQTAETAMNFGIDEALEWGARRSIENFGVRDANLVVLQISRAGLLVAALVALIGSIAPETHSHLRLATAASGAACMLSAWYHNRLMTLRRLPSGMGYLMESNSVAEAMRVANWTVVVALLTWSSLLLRGPFESDVTRVGFLFKLTYSQWCTFGPILTACTSILTIPLWHFGRFAVRTQLSTGERIMCVVIVSVILFFSFSFSTAVLTAITNGGHLCEDMPTTTHTTTTTVRESTDGCVRTEEERAFASFSCTLWFGYTTLSVLRATFGALGSCRTLDASDRHDALETLETLRWRERVWYAMRWAGRWTCLALFSNSNGIQNKAAVEMLHSLADGGDMTMYTLVSQRASRECDGEHVHPPRTRAMLTMTPSDDGTGIDRGDDSSDTRDNLHYQSQLPGLHRAKVSHMCTQAVDAGFAILDLLTQGVVAVGCAALALPPT